jgi:hypothetical protein
LTIKSKTTQSEVHAYVHILKQLTEKKSWKKSQIYTQQECLKHSEIKKYLVLKKPENVVNINEKIFYVIEAKNERKKLSQALKEAKDVNYQPLKGLAFSASLATGPLESPTQRNL